MRRIVSGFEFTSAERILLCQLVYKAMKTMEDENGSIDHLSKTERNDYYLLQEIYNVL